MGGGFLSESRRFGVHLLGPFVSVLSKMHVYLTATKDTCLSLKIYVIYNYHWNTASIVYEVLAKISNVHLSYMK